MKTKMPRMNISELSQHIPQGSMHDLLIKASGVVGGGSAFAGIMADMSQWSELAQILGNIGVFIGGLTAFGTFVYSIYKGKPK
jgi:hypothetical protein